MFSKLVTRKPVTYAVTLQLMFSILPITGEGGGIRESFSIFNSLFQEWKFEISSDVNGFQVIIVRAVRPFIFSKW